MDTALQNITQGSVDKANALFLSRNGAPLEISYKNAEQRLSARYSRPAARQPLNLEFTNDPALLQQYYQLRSRMFISVWGLKEFEGTEDKHDQQSSVLIARQGNLCVGGCRTTVSKPDKPRAMPMEGSDFSLVKALPELNLENSTYGECSRLAILPEYRDRTLAYSIWKNFVHYALQVDGDYCFWLAPGPLARNYRTIANTMGIPCTVRHDIQIPDREEYEGIKMYLGVLELTKIKKDHFLKRMDTIPDAEELAS